MGKKWIRLAFSYLLDMNSIILNVLLPHLVNFKLKALCVWKKLVSKKF